MKALFLCNVDFCAWPTHIAARMKAQVREFAADAVVSLDSGTAKALREQKIFRFGQVHDLCAIEKHWLAKPNIEARYAALEARFGVEAMRDIAMGERELSGDRIKSALFPLTPLREMSRDENKRRAYVTALVEYITLLIEAGGYRSVICYSVQDGASVAAAFVARALGIPFLSPKAIGFSAATCLFDDPRNMAPCFRAAYAALVAGQHPEQARVMADGQAALAAFRARPAPPDYMVQANGTVDAMPSLLDSAALIWRSLRRRKPENLRYPFPFSRLVFEWRRALMARLEKGARHFQSRAVLDGRNYVYFPLHYEPEASLLVSAPDEAGQVSVIERLAATLPGGHVLALKEHRPMLGRRPAGFYARLAAIPGVVLLSPFEDSFALVKGAALTATITGTAGLESVLLGRPTLFFGDHPVQIVQAGCHRARGEAVSEAIAKALAMPPAREEELAAFLGAMLEQSVFIPASEIWGGLASISFERVAQQGEHLDRFAKIILDAVRARTIRA